MTEQKKILAVEHVTMQFGGVVAVNDLSMEVREGEIVGAVAVRKNGALAAVIPLEATGDVPEREKGPSLFFRFFRSF